LVEFLGDTDTLHEKLGLQIESKKSDQQQQQQKYVCDTGRGGHLCLFTPYLLRDYGYVEWPTQPWYQEQLSLTTGTHKEYSCPLGRCAVDLCDEPKFSKTVRFFLAGRQHLDEKDLLHDLVPELMPPTFDNVEAAQEYATEQQLKQQQQQGSESEAESDAKLLWFVKAVNQNGGRAVRVTNNLSSVTTLSPDEQIQVHVPRPLLIDNKYKFHVKTYQHISYCSPDGVWEVYMHDLFYLATASRPWSTQDLSDDAQITTMRTERLYPDHELRAKWNLTELLRSKFKTVMERAIERGKLQVPAPPNDNDTDNDEAAAAAALPPTPAQFEVNSADWMLDQDGRVYLIECNGIPVLYDPTSPQKQTLVTRGLRLYDRLYHEDPDKAVVNDSDLIREALALALKGRLPSTSLWKHVATISAP
jgi:hypothetical protein